MKKRHYTPDDVRRAVNGIQLITRCVVSERLLRSVTFNAFKSTIHDWIMRIGRLAHDRRKGATRKHRKTKVVDMLRVIVKHTMETNPYWTVVQVHLHIRHQLSVPSSLSSVRRAVKSLGLSRKRASRILNPRPEERANSIEAFLRAIRNIPLTEFVSVDETSLDSRMLPHYGYCRRGDRLPPKQTAQVRSRVTLICGIATDGLKAVHVIDGSANFRHFSAFLGRLLPACQQRYVLLDNVAFHRNKYIQQAILTAGKVPLFVPPYCPQLNPVEHTFSSIKRLFRESRVSSIEPLNPEDVGIFLEIFRELGPQDWTRTFRHCLRMPQDACRGHLRREDEGEPVLQDRAPPLAAPGGVGGP